MLTIPELLFAVGYGLLVHNPIHASIHGITSKTIKDAEVIKFKPYPGICHSQFRMDCINTVVYREEDVKRFNELSFTPQAFNGTMFAFTAVGTRFVETKKTKRYIMLAGIFVPLIDATVNYTLSLTNYTPDNDFRRFNNKQSALIGIAITAAWTYAIHEWMKTTE